MMSNSRFMFFVVLCILGCGSSVVGKQTGNQLQQTAATQNSLLVDGDSRQETGDRIRVLVKEIKGLNHEFRKRMVEIRREIDDGIEVRSFVTRLSKELKSQSEKRGQDIIRIASKDPVADGVLDALMFLVRRRLDVDGGAVELLISHHSSGDQLIELAFNSAMGTFNNSAAIRQRILKSKASDDVKLVASYGKLVEAIDNFRESSVEAETKIQRMFQSFIKKAQGIEVGRNQLSSVAQGKLFEFLKLRIGKVVPEISGEDIAGKKFKLSDYRGQVVFLDFWGDW